VRKVIKQRRFEMKMRRSVQLGAVRDATSQTTAIGVIGERGDVLEGVRGENAADARIGVILPSPTFLFPAHPRRRVRHSVRMQSDHRRSLGFGADSELMGGAVMGKEGLRGGCAAERVSLSWKILKRMSFSCP
jgi:hypothetical protein